MRKLGLAPLELLLPGHKRGLILGIVLLLQLGDGTLALVGLGAHGLGVDILDGRTETGQHRHLVVEHGGGTAHHEELALLVIVDGQRHQAALAVQRHRQLVPGQHAEVAVGARDVGVGDLALEQGLVGKSHDAAHGGH